MELEMSKVIKRKKKTGKVLLGIALTLLLTAVILLGALAGAAFVIAKGPARIESARLCATFAENRFPLAGIFYSADELERSTFYMPPELLQSDVRTGGEYTSSLYYVGDASYAWDAVVITGIAPDELSLAETSVAYAGGKYAAGLGGDVDAFIIGDYLTYRGDEGEIYCFCGMGEDGILDVGAMTAYEAANSGYLWGFEAERVLVRNSAPETDLGGGYASRVALGQAADGSLILAFVNDRGFYPAGITYSELASLMYEYGAVNAVAFRAEGGFYADGKGQLGGKGASSYSLIVKGGNE
jgi:hypothetical protein